MTEFILFSSKNFKKKFSLRSLLVNIHLTYFSELKKIGSKFSIYCQSIETFADRLQMEHLLSDAPGLEIINELQYEAALASFEANLEKL